MTKEEATKKILCDFFSVHPQSSEGVLDAYRVFVLEAGRKIWQGSMNAPTHRIHELVTNTANSSVYKIIRDHQNHNATKCLVIDNSIHNKLLLFFLINRIGMQRVNIHWLYKYVAPWVGETHFNNIRYSRECSTIFNHPE